MAFRSAYKGRVRSTLETGQESLVKQSFKKECDINHILSKYQKTGLVDHVSKYQGNYDDLSEPVDYQTALNIVINAQHSFESLPSSIRKKFNNSPQEFLEFVDNPDNLPEMEKLGMIPPQAVLPDSPATPDAEAPPEATV